MVVNTRKNTLKKKTLGISVFETRQEDRIHYEKAFITALDSLSMKRIDVKEMLKDMTKEQLNNVLMKFSAAKGTANFRTNFRHLSNFLKEIQVLSMVEDKLRYAQIKIIEHFKECFEDKYCKPNGQINHAMFITHVEHQIEQISNNNKMDDDVV